MTKLQKQKGDTKKVFETQKMLKYLHFQTNRERNKIERTICTSFSNFSPLFVSRIFSNHTAAHHIIYLLITLNFNISMRRDLHERAEKAVKN